MPLRPCLLRPTRAAALARPAALAYRAVSSTPPRRAGHDDHHGHEDSSEANTNETFFSPAMRNSLILITLSVLAFPYLPRPHHGSASPSASPSSFSAAGAAPDSPAITRWLVSVTPKSELWTQRNDKHLELTKEAAEERLLFQEAERPRVWRMRNTMAFESASPNAIPVGSQVDLSDLKIKRE